MKTRKYSRRLLLRFLFLLFVSYNHNGSSKRYFCFGQEVSSAGADIHTDGNNQHTQDDPSLLETDSYSQQHETSFEHSGDAATNSVDKEERGNENQDVDRARHAAKSDVIKEDDEDDEPEGRDTDEDDDILRSVVEESQAAHQYDNDYGSVEDEKSDDKAEFKREKSDPSSKRKKTWSQPESTFDPDNEDWGTYYDPQNVFCGNYDCYKILGFDYESFGSPPITEITKRYRALSRVWHPDKSKHKNAKERFVKISRAYEVLTTRDVRREYDDMRYDVEKYWNKYGSSVLWSYAPKSDTTIVILVIMLAGNVLSWFMQKHRWRLVADRLIKAAVEEWSPSQGGSPESKLLHEEAVAILQQREKEQAAASNATESSPVVNGSNGNSTAAGRKSKGAKKISGKEKKRQEQEQLRPIIRDLVYAMDDFGGGFHKPTWRDLLIVSMVRFPITVTKETIWFLKHWIRRLRGRDLNEEERRVLTQRAVGPIVWDAATAEEQEAMISRKLWIVANLAEWSEEQEFNKLSASEKKEYLRLKKKGLLPDKEE